MVKMVKKNVDGIKKKKKSWEEKSSSGWGDELRVPRIGYKYLFKVY